MHTRLIRPYVALHNINEVCSFFCVTGHGNQRLNKHKKTIILFGDLSNAAAARRMQLSTWCPDSVSGNGYNLRRAYNNIIVVVHQ